MALDVLQLFPKTLTLHHFFRFPRCGCGKPRRSSNYDGNHPYWHPRVVRKDYLTHILLQTQVILHNIVPHVHIYQWCSDISVNTYLTIRVYWTGSLIMTNYIPSDTLLCITVSKDERTIVGPFYHPLPVLTTAVYDVTWAHDQVTSQYDCQNGHQLKRVIRDTGYSCRILALCKSGRKDILCNSIHSTSSADCSSNWISIVISLAAGAMN